VLSLVGACLIGCTDRSAPKPSEETKQSNEEAAAEIRAIIPVAASGPADLFKPLTDVVVVGTPSELAKRGSLTFGVLRLAPSDAIEEGAEEEFDLPGQMQSIPAKLVEPMLKSQDKGYASAIQPEYLTDVTCTVDGSAATGIVSFKVEGSYKGKVHYRAKRIDGKWVVEEFTMPNHGLTVTRVADGEWSVKIAPPVPKTDDRLRDDATKLQGVWKRNGSPNATRVVKGEIVTETVTQEGLPPQITTSKFALRFHKGARTIILYDRKSVEPDKRETPRHADRFGYQLDGDTWTDLVRDEDGKWHPWGVTWTRVKKK